MKIKSRVSEKLDVKPPLSATLPNDVTPRRLGSQQDVRIGKLTSKKTKVVISPAVESSDTLDDLPSEKFNFETPYNEKLKFHYNLHKMSNEKSKTAKETA